MTRIGAHRSICFQKKLRLTYEEIRRKRYWICDKHFSHESALFAGFRTLGRDAVPTLLLPDVEDCNVMEAEDVSVDSVPTSVTETCLATTVTWKEFSSINYTRSPEATGVRNPNINFESSAEVSSSFSTCNVAKNSISVRECSTSFLSSESIVATCDAAIHLIFAEEPSACCISSESKMSKRKYPQNANSCKTYSKVSNFSPNEGKDLIEARIRRRKISTADTLSQIDLNC